MTQQPFDILAFLGARTSEEAQETASRRQGIWYGPSDGTFRVVRPKHSPLPQQRDPASASVPPPEQPTQPAVAATTTTTTTLAPAPPVEVFDEASPKQTAPQQQQQPDVALTASSTHAADARHQLLSASGTALVDSRGATGLTAAEKKARYREELLQQMKENEERRKREREQLLSGRCDSIIGTETALTPISARLLSRQSQRPPPALTDSVAGLLSASATAAAAPSATTTRPLSASELGSF